MINRIQSIAFNTFREAVRDRVLYNLVFFALLLVGTTPLFGKISIGLERVILINLGLSSITWFGAVIAIFIGTGMVSKEIDKKTLYTVLSRPVRRWEFILGKYLGLCATLIVNTFFMSIGFYLSLFYITGTFTATDAKLLLVIILIVMQFLIITAISLLFSSFTTPLFSALFSFAMFAIGTFVADLRGFAGILEGWSRYVALGFSYLIPNIGLLNVVPQAAHDVPIESRVLWGGVLYALLYSIVALSAAIALFEKRNLK